MTPWKQPQIATFTAFRASIARCACRWSAVSEAFGSRRRSPTPPSPVPGTAYFSLKDATAQVRWAVCSGNEICCGAFAARDGQKVLVRARPGLYELRGEYQLVIDYMEDSGLGALKRQFEELSAKLAAEGLFAPERKRALPMIPKRIGVITSSLGAAIRRGHPACAGAAIFRGSGAGSIPVAVQGAAAAAEIAAVPFEPPGGAANAMCSF